MAKNKPTDETTETPVESPVAEPAPEILVPFAVIVNGHDRVVMATDFEDAQRQADKLRTPSTSH